MHATRATGSLLQAPSREAMHERVNETLQAKVQTRLTEISGTAEREIFVATGRHAGLDVQGDLPRLLKV